jgi:hypothetical protein
MSQSSPNHNDEMKLLYRVSFPHRDKRFSVSVAVSAIAMIAFSSGCVVSSGDGYPPCLPPAFSVNPASAKAGDRVTVQASDADCDPRYGENARVRVTVTDAAGKTVVNTTAPMNDAGGFTYSFNVPAHAAVGDAAVEATPYAIDWCDDTGRNNRAAGAAAALERASCAARIEPLSIAR